MHNVVRGCAEILPMLVGNFKSIETAVGLFLCLSAGNNSSN